MPIYEYNCHYCQEQVTLLFRSFAEVATRPAICPHCGGSHLERVISPVAVVHPAADLGPSSPGASTQNESKSLAYSMHQASQGKDFGPEFKEVTSRLEAGEKPETIEKSLRRRMGQSSQTH
jgi:putative FmdB family regulatory protein